MSSLERILEKIKADAVAEAAQIRAEAEAKQAAVLADGREKAEAAAKLVTDRAGHDVSLIADRVTTALKREARDSVLRAKQGVIDRVFQLAKEELRELPATRYAELLDGFIRRHPLGAGDKLFVPQGKAEALAAAYSLQEAKSLQAGFRIDRGGIAENFDFVELVDYLKDSLEGDVVSLLDSKRSGS